MMGEGCHHMIVYEYYWISGEQTRLVKELDLQLIKRSQVYDAASSVSVAIC